MALSWNQIRHIFLVFGIALGVFLIELLFMIGISDMYLWLISLYGPVLDFYWMLMVVIQSKLLMGMANSEIVVISLL